MRAVTVTESGFEVRDVPEPTPGAGELLLEVAACGICGSDLHAHAIGVVPGTVLGHEFAGTVVETGANVDGFRRGDLVCSMPVLACGHCTPCHRGDPIHCATGRVLGLNGASGAMADYVVCGASTSFLLERDGDPTVGATVEPLAVALNAMERAALGAADRLLVLGAGPIGLALVLWARVLGVGSVLVSDPVEGRRGLAEACGASAVVDPVSESLVGACRRHLGGRPDVVIDAAGARGTIGQTIDVAPFEGRVVIAGMHVAPEEIVASKALLKGLTISFATWYRVTHFEHTVALLRQRRLDPSPLVTHRVPLETGPAMFAELATPGSHGKVLLTR